MGRWRLVFTNQSTSGQHRIRTCDLYSVKSPRTLTSVPSKRRFQSRIQALSQPDNRNTTTPAFARKNTYHCVKAGAGQGRGVNAAGDASRGEAATSRREALGGPSRAHDPLIPMNPVFQVSLRTFASATRRAGIRTRLPSGESLQRTVMEGLPDSGRPDARQVVAEGTDRAAGLYYPSGAQRRC